MASQPVVAVYGVAVGENRVRRIGGGTLPVRELVLPDPPLARLLASDRPPWVVRVGIGALRRDGTVFVEVREVLQVLESVPTRGETMWALELTEPAETLVSLGSRPAPAPPVPRLDLDELADLLRRRSFARPEIPSGPRPAAGLPNPASEPEEPPVIVPAGLWCRLFPRASFCN